MHDGLRSILALVAMGVVPLVGAAAEIGEGERLYRVHCQACHGKDGTGEGPMQEQLEIDPPDLTTISARRDGEFPHEEIHQIIDGRLESPAHGSREMPVWGFTFQSIGGESTPAADVEALITALTRYLESIQKPDGGGRGDGGSADE